MQYIQTHARGAKFSTYYDPPNHPQSSSSCGRHDQHKQHSILPDHHTNQLQLRTDCTARSLSLSLFVSLFRVHNKHYILLSSCKALLFLPATTLLLLLLPATPLLLLLLLLLPATSLVVLLFPATTLLLVLLPATTLLVLLLPATTNPLLLVLQLLQSKRDSSKQSKAKQSKLATSPTNAKAREKQKDKFPVTKCLPHKCMHGNTNCWLAGWLAGWLELVNANFVCLFVCLFVCYGLPMQCCCKLQQASCL